MIKNQDKPPKNGHFEGLLLIFSKTGLRRELGFFLQCNKCIKTLHWSYQTPPYNNFYFSG